MLGNCCDRPEIVEPFQTLALVMDQLDRRSYLSTDPRRTPAFAALLSCCEDFSVQFREGDDA
jgi:hypothetical protein